MSHNPRLTLSNTTTSTGSATDERMDFSYDGTLVTSISQSGTLNKNISYTYNNDFNPTSMTYANQTENYTYNADNEAVSIGNYTITRQKKNRVIKVSDGIYTHISKYNRYGELKHQRDNALRVRLFRNKAGQIVKKVEKLKGERKRVYRYSYDARGRLIKVRKNHKTVESYTYDSNGNRASATVYGTTITASYTLDDNLVVYGDNSYLYDDDGYLKEKTTPQGTTTYSYGTRGELLAVTTPTKTITYKHNAKNQRVSKEVNGTTVEKYLWGNLTTLLAIYDANDNLIQRFEYADQRMPVAMTDANGTKYYLHYDQVGSLRAISDTRHNIVKEITYDTYGNILTDSNPSFTIPFGFAGGLYDADTKLTRFGYRDYDAYTGKWTAKDPIGFSGGDSNLYGYVLGDPVNWIDPMGLWIPQAIGAVIGGGIEVWNNGWSWDVAVAAAAGAVGGFGTSIGKAAAYGAVGSGINNGYQQGTDPCKDFDWEEFAGSTALGAFGGAFGGAAGNIGRNINNYSGATPTITNISYPTINWSGPIGNYGNAGAAAGAVTGGAISNSGGN